MGSSANDPLRWSQPLPPRAAPAVAVTGRLQRSGYQAYLVGGAVRDLVMGLEPGDFDVVTDAPPEAVLALFPRSEAVGAAFGVVLVIAAGTAVETATFRTEHSYGDLRHPNSVRLVSSLQEDSARRDFTVNALYLDPATGRIYDPQGGVRDCQRRLLRAIGDPELRFREDALRLLRAPRLAAQCGLTIDAATLESISSGKEGIRRIAKERIGKEIGLMLTGPDPAGGLQVLADSGVLQIILPEVAAMQGVPQPPEYHPEGDVWTHTLIMLRQSPSRSLTLGLAILLHDVGKPPTLTFAERIRFDGHAKVGANMTLAIGRRLRLPARVYEQAASLVAQHLHFLNVRDMRQATLKRFLRQDNIEDHLELHRLDCLASHGNLGNYEFCRAALERLGTEHLRPAALLGGRDLLAMGYAAGPQIGQMLRELETAQLEGAVSTREEAVAWIQQTFPRHPEPGTAPSS